VGLRWSEVLKGVHDREVLPFSTIRSECPEELDVFDLALDHLCERLGFAKQPSRPHPGFIFGVPHWRRGQPRRYPVVVSSDAVTLKPDRSLIAIAPLRSRGVDTKVVRTIDVLDEQSSNLLCQLVADLPPSQLVGHLRSVAFLARSQKVIGGREFHNSAIVLHRGHAAKGLAGRSALT